MEMEELERKSNIERLKDDMTRQIAATTGQSAQLLRSMNGGSYNPPTDIFFREYKQLYIDQLAETLIWYII